MRRTNSQNYALILSTERQANREKYANIIRFLANSYRLHFCQGYGSHKYCLQIDPNFTYLSSGWYTVERQSSPLQRCLHAQMVTKLSSTTFKNEQFGFHVLLCQINEDFIYTYERNFQTVLGLLFGWVVMAQKNWLKNLA